MKQRRVIDVDGHCIENDSEVLPHIEYSGRSLGGADVPISLWPSLDGWIRVPGAAGEPSAWRTFLDDTQMEGTFIYPTKGLAHGLIQDRAWAVALAKAYNDWLYQKYTKLDARLQGIALLPVQDVGAAAGELRRAHKELGMRGGVIPAATLLGKAYGHADFDPLWEEAEKLDVPIGIHGAPSRGFGFDFFDTFIKAHTLEHPFAVLIQFTSMIFDGVFERFPRLRVAFLECGAGWVPYMMDRMDEEYERLGKRWAPSLRRRPSEVIRGGNVYVSCEIEERTLPFVVELMGEDNILFASDYPHERRREAFLKDIPEFAERTDIPERAKEKILFHNAQRFYRLG